MIAGDEKMELDRVSVLCTQRSDESAVFVICYLLLSIVLLVLILDFVVAGSSLSLPCLV